MKKLGLTFFNITANKNNIIRNKKDQNIANEDKSGKNFKKNHQFRNNVMSQALQYKLREQFNKKAVTDRVGHFIQKLSDGLETHAKKHYQTDIFEGGIPEEPKVRKLIEDLGKVFCTILNAKSTAPVERTKDPEFRHEYDAVASRENVTVVTKAEDQLGTKEAMAARLKDGISKYGDVEVEAEWAVGLGSRLKFRQYAPILALALFSNDEQAKKLGYENMIPTLKSARASLGGDFADLALPDQQLTEIMHSLPAIDIEN